MSYLSLGNRIIDLRQKMKLSQIEFAKFLGIPQPTLSVYENNKATPPIDVMGDMADKCNVSLDWLLGRTSERKITALDEFAIFLYGLTEYKEVNASFEIQQDEDAFAATIKFDGNDKSHIYNQDLCNLLQVIARDVKARDERLISQLDYEILRDVTIKHVSFPLTSREYEDIETSAEYKSLIQSALENEKS